jgi:hypothetical protein
VGAGSGALTLGNNFYASSTDYLYARTGFGATSYQMNTSLASHIWYNAPVGTAGGIVTFSETMKLSSTELITFGATDTGEAHIFGGSARVNGSATITDLVIVGNNIGYGGITPNGNAGVTSTIESHNGSQIASRIVVPQLYVSSNVVGSPFSPTRAVDGYATQLQLESFGGNINLNVAGTGLAGSAITWATALNITSTGAATFSSSIEINNTVAAAVAVASTHKVTMVIGGVTYYLLATT